MCTTGPLLRSHTGLLRQLPRSRCLADTVSFALVLLTHRVSFLFWVMPGPYAFLLWLRSHTLALPPFEYLPPFLLARVSQFLSDSTNSLRTESLQVHRDQVIV